MQYFSANIHASALYDVSEERESSFEKDYALLFKQYGIPTSTTSEPLHLLENDSIEFKEFSLYDESYPPTIVVHETEYLDTLLHQ